MIVLGLDQSPRGSGFAFGDGTSAPTFGYREFPDYGDNEAALIAHIRPWVRNLLKSSAIAAVFTEQLVVNSKHLNMPVLMKQCAVVCAIAVECGDLGVDHYQVIISEWRVHFLGMGGAPKYAGNRTEFLKDLAMKECAARDLYPSNHHEAEAIGIWSFGLAQLDPAYRARSKWQQRRAESRRDVERRERSAA